MEMKNTYYWLASYPLEKGSIILPGNWGRILDLYQDKATNLNCLKESLLEQVRKESYPEKPSRLKCTFLCESLQDLTNFKYSNNRLLDLAYEVELLDEKSIFSTDWSIISNLPVYCRESEIHKYWKGTDITNKEILTESRIQIINRLDI